MIVTDVNPFRRMARNQERQAGDSTTTHQGHNHWVDLNPLLILQYTDEPSSLERALSFGQKHSLLLHRQLSQHFYI